MNLLRRLMLIVWCIVESIHFRGVRIPDDGRSVLRLEPIPPASPEWTCDEGAGAIPQRRPLAAPRGWVKTSAPRWAP